MDEVELIDKALEGCYGLQNRIATLLAKLTDISVEKGISLSTKDSLTKKAKKTSRSRKNKEKKTSSNSEDPNKFNGKLKKSIFDTLDTESGAKFTRLSDIFVEANADAYVKSYDTKFQQYSSRKKIKYNKRKDNNDVDSEKILTKLSDIIVEVNAENSTKNRNAKPSGSSRNNNKSKGKKNKATHFQPHTNERSLTIDDLKLKNSCYPSDIESDDSGFSSGLRSLQEINSAYAKIDKRFIEVKRSVESVVVGMKHVDEIINRQKGVFHINFACADNETFICRH